MNGLDFCQLVSSLGIDFFTGVPDSTLKSVFAVLETDSRLAYVPAVREDVAVGLAVGAYVAGRCPMVLMQNSGLGHCLNSLTSLALLYGAPILVVIGWRGFDRHDSPEHKIMGKSVLSLLSSIEMPYTVLENSHVPEQVERAYRGMVRDRVPTALIVRDGIIVP